MYCPLHYEHLRNELLWLHTESLMIWDFVHKSCAGTSPFQSCLLYRTQSSSCKLSLWFIYLTLYVQNTSITAFCLTIMMVFYFLESSGKIFVLHFMEQRPWAAPRSANHLCFDNTFIKSPSGGSYLRWDELWWPHQDFFCKFFGCSWTKSDFLSD